MEDTFLKQHPKLQMVRNCWEKVAYPSTIEREVVGERISAAEETISYEKDRYVSEYAIYLFNNSNKFIPVKKGA